MRTLVRYLEHAHWQRQGRWRQAVWQIMGNTGLTGIHAWPMHRDWVEFSFLPMKLKNLPASFDGQKVVQISDLHYSPLVWETYLYQYVEWINDLKPAIVVATGDLYMGGRRYASRVAKLLASVKATHATIAIMGNHDYGIDGKAILKRGVRRAAYLEHALEAEGIPMLRNEILRVPDDTGRGQLTFVGLDDDWAGQMRPATAFSGVRQGEPIICLVHNPANCMRLMDYPWQWMLTGHTHGRQLASGGLGQRLYPGKYRQFTHGLYTINGRHLYVNRGLSYGQRGREWCRPEVTVFELRSGEKTATAAATK
jgi:predicted MPP superfamily phosphohydrolase